MCNNHEALCCAIPFNSLSLPTSLIPLFFASPYSRKQWAALFVLYKIPNEMKCLSIVPYICFKCRVSGHRTSYSKRREGKVKKTCVKLWRDGDSANWNTVGFRRNCTQQGCQRLPTHFTKHNIILPTLPFQILSSSYSFVAGNEAGEIRF